MWNAIYYKDEILLDKYKKRFEKNKLFISPDYSKCGDVPQIENLYRTFRSRIVSLWLTLEIDAVVVPLVSNGNLWDLDFALMGLEDCVTVAFNTKGQLQDSRQNKLLRDSIRVTVDALEKLKSIVVYASTPNNREVFNLFSYAIEKGIEVQIPDNLLRNRNKILGEDKDGLRW